ncbi:helix-turn-helix transcriptional regulator [Paraburkholderia madseniana]|jgi:transcriptional regulator with XRE-family HTH domain|uniref:helix-turn-helix domain-containing protein n=1 Tax=Paraburkholderia madseniana TaxID=2599607 RepID=UPI0038BB3AE4
MSKPTSTRAQFAHNLKFHRSRLGVSQVDVSRSAGLAPNTVGYIENNAPSVQLDTIHRLAVALNVDPCVLMSTGVAGTTGPYEQRQLEECVVQNLKQFRARLNLTQEDVATAAGLTRNYVYKIEGRHVRVTLDTLDAIAQALGMAPWQLLV